ncbi:hypothetical protein GGR56DRAFT_624221 [Xylariaceae sp. FL0804]|nr:hypothetical protein GGR56DRAFT_624221 [Xylariaceae sp. FL0804]
MTAAALVTSNGEIVRLLLHLGIPLRSDLPRRVAMAAHDSAMDILLVFVEHGWDVNRLDHGKYTSPLELATSSVPLTCSFLENGADPNIVTAYGFRPIEAAATNPPATARAIINLHISAGAQLSQSSALHTAVSHVVAKADCISVMEFLVVEEGYPINALSPDRPCHPRITVRGKQSTALHWAVSTLLNRRRQRGGDMVARIKWLLRHGADARVKDSSGRTPADLLTETSTFDQSTGETVVTTAYDQLFQLLEE